MDEKTQMIFEQAQDKIEDALAHAEVDEKTELYFFRLIELYLGIVACNGTHKTIYQCLACMKEDGDDTQKFEEYVHLMDDGIDALAQHLRVKMAHLYGCIKEASLF